MNLFLDWIELNGCAYRSNANEKTQFLDAPLYLVWLLNPKFTESKMGLMPF